MRKQATGKKRKIYAKILRLLPVTVLRFTLYAFYPPPAGIPASEAAQGE